MKTPKIMRLNSLCVWDLIDFAKELGLPLEEDRASAYCHSTANTQTYGFYLENKLISIMTATLLITFPNAKIKNGREVYISSCYTLPEYKDLKFGSNTAEDLLLKQIEGDAAYLGADVVVLNKNAEGYSPSDLSIKYLGGETQ